MLEVSLSLTRNSVFFKEIESQRSSVMEPKLQHRRSHLGFDVALSGLETQAGRTCSHLPRTFLRKGETTSVWPGGPEVQGNELKRRPEAHPSNPPSVSHCPSEWMQLTVGLGFLSLQKKPRANPHSRESSCVVFISFEHEFYLISMWQIYGVNFASTWVKNSLEGSGDNLTAETENEICPCLAPERLTTKVQSQSPWDLAKS